MQNSAPDLKSSKTQFLITGFTLPDIETDKIKERLIAKNRLLTKSNFFIFKKYTKSETNTLILNVRSRALYEEVLREEIIGVGNVAALAYRFTKAMQKLLLERRVEVLLGR